MAPVTQIGLVFLTTASVVLGAQRGGLHARHSHKRSRPYISAPVYGAGNSTSVAGPTAGSPETTSTRTETLTSTITQTITAPEEGSSGGAGGVPVTGASEPTCGGTVYVTVTDSVTVTATPGAQYPSESSSETAPANTYAATTPAAATTSEAAAETSAEAPESSSSSANAIPTYDGHQRAYNPHTSSAAAAAPTPYSSSQAAPAPATSEAAPSYSAPASYTSSSSAAASPSAPAASGGKLKTKRGCLYQADMNSDCAAMSEDEVSWATNWADNANSGAGKCTFVPQLWGTTKVGGDGKLHDYTLSWKDNADAAIKAGAPALLGFNEPDIPEQANILPADATEPWKLVSQYAGQATIVSPSVTSRQQNGVFQGLDWLSQFAGNGSSWDATGVHFYASCNLDPVDQNSYLKSTVDEAYKRFQKPVWVTEFGCSDGASTAQIEAFLKVAVAYLEGEPNVHQYAAFKADLLVSGGTLNAAGQAYVSTTASSAPAGY